MSVMSLWTYLGGYYTAIQCKVYTYVAVVDVNHMASTISLGRDQVRTWVARHVKSLIRMVSFVWVLLREMLLVVQNVRHHFIRF